MNTLRRDFQNILGSMSVMESFEIYDKNPKSFLRGAYRWGESNNRDFHVQKLAFNRVKVWRTR